VKKTPSKSNWSEDFRTCVIPCFWSKPELYLPGTFGKDYMKAKLITTSRIALLSIWLFISISCFFQFVVYTIKLIFGIVPFTDQGFMVNYFLLLIIMISLVPWFFKNPFAQ